MFKKILIANRGEIACRVIKTCQSMGIHAVGIYSSADKNGLHVKKADSAFYVGPARSQESYLNIEAIINAAKRSGAQAIHPGYGFLSENPTFAKACVDEGIVFIGPSLFAMDVMASKQRAKQLLEKTTVPLIPGYHGESQEEADLLEAAKNIGFPVLLKAAYGGGGKGMRQVNHPSAFSEAFHSARREAMACFADGRLLVEKYLTNPRHIEIQVIADNHGQALHLFERDCSIQRRHQKIIEEAPAAHLPLALRDQLIEAALEVVKAIDYRGAGTVEFLVSNDQFYFIEMNTRLQVEHPVTEMITGLDLVAWQLKVAANERLPLRQDAIHIHGHAIECRICAEDPVPPFLPSTGQLTYLKEPTGEGVRLDSGVEKGDVIHPYYDPMIAKLIVWGETREEALLRLQRALPEYRIGGLKTNLPFLERLVSTPAFISGEVDTHFLSVNTVLLSEPNKQLALWAAVSYDYLKLTSSPIDSLQQSTFSWQMHLETRWRWYYEIEEERFTVTIIAKSNDQFSILGGPQLSVRGGEGSRVSFELDQQIYAVDVEVQDQALMLYLPQGRIRVKRMSEQTSILNQGAKNPLIAPMPGTVVALLKQAGDVVKEGERLMVLEAMKMEHAVLAPGNGRLKEIFYTVGTQVEEGAELLVFEPVSHQTENELS